MTRARCAVCHDHSARPRMCTSCMRAFDRALTSNPTPWEVIQWAARRARRFEHLRLARKPRKPSRSAR